MITIKKYFRCLAILAVLCIMMRIIWIFDILILVNKGLRDGDITVPTTDPSVDSTPTKTDKDNLATSYYIQVKDGWLLYFVLYCMVLYSIVLHRNNIHIKRYRALLLLYIWCSGNNSREFITLVPIIVSSVFVCSLTFIERYGRILTERRQWSLSDARCRNFLFSFSLHTFYSHLCTCAVPEWRHTLFVSLAQHFSYPCSILLHFLRKVYLSNSHCKIAIFSAVTVGAWLNCVYRAHQFRQSVQTYTGPFHEEANFNFFNNFLFFRWLIFFELLLENFISKLLIFAFLSSLHSLHFTTLRFLSFTYLPLDDIVCFRFYLHRCQHGLRHSTSHHSTP